MKRALAPRGSPAVRRRSAAAAPPRPGRSSRAARSAASGSARPPRRCAPRSGSATASAAAARTTTWYFTYSPSRAMGLAVELDTQARLGGLHAVAAARLERAEGPQLGAVEAQVTTLAGPLVVLTCSGYEALVADTPHARTVYYVARREALGLRAAARPSGPVPVIELARRAGGGRSGSTASRTARRCFTSRTLDGLVGASVHVKAECFQRGGAFKFRGAYNKIASLARGSARARCARVLVGQPRAGRRDRRAPARHDRDDPHAGGRAGSESSTRRAATAPRS